MFPSTSNLLSTSRVALSLSRCVSMKQVQHYTRQYLKHQKRDLAKLDKIIQRGQNSFEEMLCCRKECNPMKVITAKKPHYTCQTGHTCRKYE